MLWKLLLILISSFIITWISYRSFSIPAGIRFITVSLVLVLLIYPRIGKILINQSKTRETVLAVDGELINWLDSIEDFSGIKKFILTEDTAIKPEPNYPARNLIDPGRSLLSLLYLLNDFPGTLIWITRGEKFDQMTEDIFKEIPRVYIFCDNPVNQPHLEIGVLGGKKFLNRNERGWVKFSIINNYTQPETLDFEITLNQRTLQDFSDSSPMIIPGYSRNIISSQIDPVQQNLGEGHHRMEFRGDDDTAIFDFWISDDYLNVDLIADQPHWCIGKIRRVLVEEPRINFRGTIKGISGNYLQFSSHQEQLVNRFPDLSLTQVLLYVGTDFSPSVLQSRNLSVVVWMMTRNLETDLGQFYPVQLTEQGRIYPFINWLDGQRITGNYILNISGQDIVNSETGRVLTELHNSAQMILFNNNGIYVLALPGSQLQSWFQQDNSDKIDSLLINLINWSRIQSPGELSLFLDKSEVRLGQPLNITVVSDSISEVWIRKVEEDSLDEEESGFWEISSEENYLTPAGIDSEAQYYQVIFDHPGNYLILSSRGQLRDFKQIQVKPQLFYRRPQFDLPNLTIVDPEGLSGLLETLPPVKVEVEVEKTILPWWVIGLMIIGLLILEWFLKYRQSINSTK